MQEAEDQMRKYLAGKTLAWLKEAVYKEFSDNKKEAIAKWMTASIH